MTEFSLRDLILDTLERSKEPDPHVLARRLLARIPEDQTRAALAECLAERVRVEVTRQRMHAAPVSYPPPAPESARRPGRSKWATYAPLLQRYCIAGEWKMLGECGADDLDALADEYARRAAEQAAIEMKFRRLAEQIRSVGANTLAELFASGGQETLAA